LLQEFPDLALPIAVDMADRMAEFEGLAEAPPRE
jgi:hypothetical protein